MIRYLSFFLFWALLCLNVAIAQQAIHNFGNLKLHQNGSLVFHTNLINDGSFDENSGLVGFYSHDNTLLIDGAFSPVFRDFEVGVENDLQLGVSLDVTHSLFFIYGDIATPRERKNVSLRFREKSGHDGVTDESMINGYSMVEGQKDFTFPIGDGSAYKPLSIKFIDGSFQAKCAYFDENVEFPTSLAVGMDTREKDPGLSAISPQGFWVLNTSGRIQVSLHWNENSNMSYYADRLENICVTAWNKQENKWDDLGNAVLEGDLNEGLVTSHIFNANDYEVFTLGFKELKDDGALGNYAMSPNGDGINEKFTLPIIDRSPNNLLQIFNRSGQVVFKKENYRDEFTGRGNINIFKSNEELPEGVYFYLLDLKDLNLKFKGYFYLTND